MTDDYSHLGQHPQQAPAQQTPQPQQQPAQQPPPAAAQPSQQPQAAQQQAPAQLSQQAAQTQAAASQPSQAQQQPWQQAAGQSHGGYRFPGQASSQPQPAAVQPLQPQQQPQQQPATQPQAQPYSAAQASQAYAPGQASAAQPYRPSPAAGQSAVAQPAATQPAVGQAATPQPAATQPAVGQAAQAAQSAQYSQAYRQPAFAGQTAAYQQAAQASAAMPQRPAVASPRQSKPKQSKAVPLVMGLVGVLAGALVTAGILLAIFLPNASGATTDPNGYTIETGSGIITITPPDEDATLAEMVATKALPSVVNIDAFASSDSGYFSDTGNSGQLEQFGLGSGVVISADGYILTNHHVIDGGTDFLVRFDQDTQYRARVVGSDPESDLAVLKVDAKNLVPMEIGDSSAVKVGEWVMALGSPFGLEKSVSTGIVSATLRSTAMESTNGINFYAKMIQTDAAINPGNSGGALVNAEGKLIGINTIIASASGSSAGVGFAIPSNYAMGIANQIMSGRQVEHAYLGIQLRNVDAGRAINLDSDVLSGAVVGVIVENSPAANSGLKEGDIITKIDNMRVSSAAELIINIRGYLPGDKVTLEFVRDGQTYTVDITLGSDKGISS